MKRYINELAKYVTLILFFGALGILAGYSVAYLGTEILEFVSYIAE